MPFNFLPLVLGAGDALGGFLAKREADDAADDAGRILTEGQNAAIGPSLAAVQQGSEARAQAAIDARGDVTAALERSLGFIDPELVSARGAQNLVNDALGVNGQDAQTAFFQNFEDDPGFQAELADRIGAIDKSAASRGLLLSGRTLKAVGDEGQRFRRSAFTDRLNRLTTQGGRAESIAARGAGFISGAGRDTANLRVRGGEAVAGGAEARGGIQASQALNLADIGANRRLTRGANQTRFIDTLTTAGGTAVAGADFGPAFTAKPFLDRRFTTGATK